MVKVLSHNWSSYAIFNALNREIEQGDIICNELQCNEKDTTTGELLQQCVTSVDKMKHFQCWKEYHQHNQAGYTMYIGDPWGDYLASCGADISIWMHTDHNHQFLDIVNDKYLMNKQDNQCVLATDSWL